MKFINPVKLIKKNPYIAGMILCVCVMLLSGFMILNYSSQDKLHTDEFEELVKLVEDSTGVVDSTGAQEIIAEDDDKAPTPGYSLLHMQNSDFVGWIKIDGTSVNYPVMQTPGEPDYYLKRSFDQQRSDYGVPYADASCDVFLPSDNIIIYGHHMKNGKMFGALRDYKNADFWEQHNTICFDTLAENGAYLIVAVFETAADSDKGFAYYNFINAKNEDEFNAYISKCKELALYDTGITAAYGDKLITLSTCDYSNSDVRLAVVAKKIVK